MRATGLSDVGKGSEAVMIPAERELRWMHSPHSPAHPRWKPRVRNAAH